MRTGSTAATAASEVLMCWRRVIGLTGKELRELRWMAVLFVILAMAVVTAGVTVRYAASFSPAAALLDLLGVATLFALLLAERQGADVGRATRRHLLSFPLQPLEVIAGKALAFLLAQLLLVTLGITTYAVTAHLFAASSVVIPTLLLSAGRILLLTLACWALELAVACWPQVGLVTVLTLLSAYGLGLALLPFMRTMFNGLHLLFFWVDDTPLLGPSLAAALLIWSGLVLRRGRSQHGRWRTDRKD